MKTTNMPGFTAEVPLRKTGERYRATAAHNFKNGEQAVVAQLRAGNVAVGGRSQFGFGCDWCYDAYFGCAQFCAIACNSATACENCFASC